jgi:hypothetical protein
MGLGRLTSVQSVTWICTKHTKSWLVHGSNIFGVRTSRRQHQTHKTHHGSDLGEATTFPLIVFFVAFHGGPHLNGILSWDSQVGVPKFSQLGLSQLWGHIFHMQTSDCNEV